MERRAASAASLMKVAVSLPRLSKIFISGSRYVSMQRLRKKNMSLMVIRAILERDDRIESDNLTNCFTSEWSVAPC